MSSSSGQSRAYLLVLSSGIISMGAGVLMLLVDGFSNGWLGPLVFIPAGGFFTLLGLRARAKARKRSESGSNNRNT